MIKDCVTSQQRLSLFLSNEQTEKEKQREMKRIKRRIKSDSLIIMISFLCFVIYLIVYISTFGDYYHV